MQSRSIRLIIISSSCLLHGIILLLLLVFYTTPHSEFTPFIPPLSADTYFYNPPLSTPLEAPAMQTEPIFAAQLKPGASALASSLESLDRLSETDEASLCELEQEAAQESEGTKQPVPTEVPEQDPAQSATQLTLDSQASNEFNLQSSSHKKMAKPKQSAKKEAQAILSKMAQGYLEQLHNEGTNLIKTIGGDPQAVPTAHQLRYERYLAKIQWCIQNAHAINRTTSYEPAHAQAIVKVAITIQRTGTLQQLAVIESSGKPSIDAYVKKVIEYASASFPPLPDYISGDTHTINFIIQYQYLYQ